MEQNSIECINCVFANDFPPTSNPTNIPTSEPTHVTTTTQVATTTTTTSSAEMTTIPGNSNSGALSNVSLDVTLSGSFNSSLDQNYTQVCEIIFSVMCFSGVFGFNLFKLLFFCVLFVMCYGTHDRTYWKMRLRIYCRTIPLVTIQFK